MLLDQAFIDPIRAAGDHQHRLTRRFASENKRFRNLTYLTSNGLGCLFRSARTCRKLYNFKPHTLAIQCRLNTLRTCAEFTGFLTHNIHLRFIVLAQF
jgi:hypothetical protein